MPELSGPQWVARFPGSRDTNDLIIPFRTDVERFVAALRDAGASVQISSTYRPPQRAYLMHHAWNIARLGSNPESVPVYSGTGAPVDIDWVHRTSGGASDLAASRVAAEAMVRDYGMVHRAALRSRHTEGRAIDMSILWSGALTIKDLAGNSKTITSTPRTGDNTELHVVGGTYGVIKRVDDPPHWSDDGA